MFAAPPERLATLFVRLPKHLELNRTTEWGGIRPYGTMTSFLEGPSFDREGHLYCVDIPYGRILRISPQREFTVVAEYDGEPNGLKIHRDGRLFIADQKHGVLVMHPGEEAPRPFLIRVGNERLRGPNDLFFAKNGDLYFTDQGQTGLHDPTGRVIRVREDGRIDVLLDNVPSPNGLVLNEDETMLYLAVTRANAIWRVPLLASGGVSKVGTYIQLSGGVGPDGMAIDADGNVAVAHPGLGTVWLFDRYGEPVLRVRSPEGRMTTNVAFGGVGGRTLFITESHTGTILSADLETAGSLMFSHR